MLLDTEEGSVGCTLVPPLIPGHSLLRFLCQRGQAFQAQHQSCHHVLTEELGGCDQHRRCDHHERVLIDCPL